MKIIKVPPMLTADYFLVRKIKKVEKNNYITIITVPHGGFKMKKIFEEKNTPIRKSNW